MSNLTAKKNLFLKTSKPGDKVLFIHEYLFEGYLIVIFERRFKSKGSFSGSLVYVFSQESQQGIYEETFWHTWANPPWENNSKKLNKILKVKKITRKRLKITCSNALGDSCELFYNI